MRILAYAARFRKIPEVPRLGKTPAPAEEKDRRVNRCFTAEEKPGKRFFPAGGTGLGRSRTAEKPTGEREKRAEVQAFGRRRDPHSSPAVAGSMARWSNLQEN